MTQMTVRLFFGAVVNGSRGRSVVEGIDGTERVDRRGGGDGRGKEIRGRQLGEGVRRRRDRLLHLIQRMLHDLVVRVLLETLVLGGLLHRLQL